VTNAGVRGRPIAPLVLSSQERAYLERQVRRHRVARSLSERCRAILRCTDGLPSKSVAAELGLHEHTVGKWRRRFLKDRCDGLPDEARLAALEPSTTIRLLTEGLELLNSGIPPGRWRRKPPISSRINPRVPHSA
jgi:transposase-like protein